MLATSVLYSEVVDNEDKCDWSSFVSPEAWSGGALVIPMTK